MTVNVLANTLDRYRSIRTVGGKLPDSFDRIEAAWNTIYPLEDHDTAQRRLLTAALAGEGDLVTLYRDALVSSTAGPQVHALVRNSLAQPLTDALARDYRAVAGDNYRTMARRFDEAAEALTKGMSTFPASDASAEVAITWPPAKQKAWAAAPALIDTVGRAYSHLVWAIQLSDAQHSGNPGWAIDPGDLHRRRVWEAWSNTGEHRLGKWAALLELGVELVTPHSLDVFEFYRAPEPMATRHVESYENGFHGTRFEEYDPEDPEEIARARSEASRRGGTVLIPR